jgi:hypothetical protein
VCACAHLEVVALLVAVGEEEGREVVLPPLLEPVHAAEGLGHLEEDGKKTRHKQKHTGKNEKL